MRFRAPRMMRSALKSAAQRKGHKLAGTLGTFGLDDCTTCARALEFGRDRDAQIDLDRMKEAARGLRAAVESKPA